MSDPIEAFMSGNEDYEMAGTEIVGARRQQGRGGPQGPGGQQQNRQRVAAGFPRQAVAAGASYDIQVTVSEAFRPDRIVFSDEMAAAMSVVNIRIGTKSLNVTSNPIAGSLFRADAIGTHLQGYTAQPGVGFIISVTNFGTASVTTSGGAVGPSVS